MKKIILALVIALVFACKNDKKEKVTPVVKEEVKKEIVTEIDMPDFTTWGKQGVELEKTTENYLTSEVYKIDRVLENTSSYVFSWPVSVIYSDTYKATIIVKKSDNTSFFGMRILGEYPDRIDAVFDLDKGVVKGVKKTRDFENPKSNIESLGDGWYKCSVIGELNADKIKIIFGPTTENSKIEGWETKTEKSNTVYIVPESLKFEHLELK